MIVALSIAGGVLLGGAAVWAYVVYKFSGVFK